MLNEAVNKAGSQMNVGVLRKLPTCLNMDHLTLCWKAIAPHAVGSKPETVATSLQSFSFKFPSTEDCFDA